MPLILDTYNILHATGVLPPEQSGLDVAALITLIESSRYAHDLAHLVCDGTPPGDLAPHAAKRIRVRYAGPGADADTLIMEMIDAAPDPKRLIIVSSDREIRAAARRRRCRVLTSEAFLHHLALDVDRDRSAPKADQRKPPSPLSHEQVDQWIAIFGLTEDDLSHEHRAATPPPAAPPPAAPSDATLPSDPPDSSSNAPSSASTDNERPTVLRSPKRDDRRHRARKASNDEGVVFPTDVLREAEDMLDDDPDDDLRDDQAGREQG